MFISLFLFLFFTQPDSTAQAVVVSSAELFSSAVCLSVTPNGNILAIDQKKNSLSQISEKGIVTKSFDGSGWGNYEFDNPVDVSSSFLLDVYVTDFNNRRIQRYDKNLNYVQTYDESTLPAEVGRFQPRACVLSSQGDLFVVEIDGRRILKINNRTQLLKEFGTYKDGAGKITEPHDIAISQSDEIFVLDQSNIIAYDLFGNYVRTIHLPKADWMNIQVSERTLLATASDQIFIRSLDTDEQTTITHASIVGLPSKEPFVDAIIQEQKLIVVTSTVLYYCSINR